MAFPTTTDKCHVCSKQSHGIHFGAVTCRACAAYFRRAIIKKYAELECWNGEEKCENQTELCKKCRLEKCLEAGMTEERLQLGRDPMSSTVKHFVDQPSLIICSSSETTNRTKIDFTKLIEKASTILSSTSKLQVGINTLNQLTNALTTSSETSKLCDKFGRTENLAIWEMNFLQVTRWFTHCDRFQELPLNKRIEFIESVWVSWSKLNNSVMTAKRKTTQGKLDSQEVHLSEEYVINIEKVELDTSWFSKENFLGTIQQFYVSKVIEELISFRPTPQETTYMLAVFSFRHAANILRDDFEELSENMIQILANDLHDYYTDELKLNQYAQRIAQIMKIVNILERNHHERMEKFELARMFDVIKVDFSHPELIYGKK